MSDAVAWKFVDAPACMPSRTAWPRLRLVDPDARVGSDACDCPIGPVRTAGPDWADGTNGRADLREVSCSLGGATTRLTRRGRLTITLVVTFAVLILATVLATSVDAASPQIDHATTVSAGETLSEVAAAQLPGLRISDAVARIQLVNGLNTTQVHAGQILLIPEGP